MKTSLPTGALIATACFLLMAGSLQAGSVTDWHTFRATTATTIYSGQGTDDPVFGSYAAPASQGFLVGYLGSPLSLVNVGDRISLTFSISLSDPLGAGIPGDNFRFSLWNMGDNAQIAAENTASAGVNGYTDHWRGYWFGVRTSTGTGSTGSIRERIADNTHPLSNTGATLLGNPTGDQILWNTSTTEGVGGALYAGQMTLELTSLGVDLSGTFSGNGTQNTFAYSDNSLPYTSGFAAVAFLNGGATGVDQVLFHDVTVTYIPVPEPSTLALACGGVLSLLLRRRVRGRI